MDICSRIALMEHGKIIRDLMNENNSAEQELEDYFNAGVEEAPVATEDAVQEEAPAVLEETTTEEETPAVAGDTATQD